jgi:acetyl esterase/lipase
VEKGGKRNGGPIPSLAAYVYIVADLNYRLRPTPHPAQIQDCKAAIRWPRANAKRFHIYRSKVAVWGHSAGGHLAGLVGTSDDSDFKDVTPEQSSRVQAVLMWSGPSDFLRDKSEADLDDTTGLIAGLLGGPLRANRSAAKAANPITYVTKDDPPFLLIHGETDHVLNVKHSQWMHRALTDAGVKSQIEVLPDTKHWGPLFEAQSTHDIVKAFLRRTLFPVKS